MTISQPSPLRIALVVPPWYSLPPSGYGGIEAICTALADGLVARGHDVVTIGVGSRGTDAAHVATYNIPPSERITEAIPEVVHAALAAQIVNDIAPDVVHDHSFAGPLSAGGRRAPTVVTTHRQVRGEYGLYYGALGDTISMVALSNAQRRLAPHLSWLATVYNAIPVDDVPLTTRKGDHAVFLGRMSPEKGVAEAIDVAKRAGRRLVIAGKCTEPVEKSYFDEFVRPHLGPDVEWIGEVGSPEKWQLLGEAACMLFPITWNEPFGMVMIESMACGTPVVALNRASVPEVVEHGVTGYVCGDLDEMVAALGQVDGISPEACRKRVRDRFDVPAMIKGYEDTYRLAIESPHRPLAPAPLSGAA